MQVVSVIYEKENILKAQKAFYEALYAKREQDIEGDVDIEDFFFNNMSPSLDENEQKELEGEITEQELLKCFKTLKNGKSPGLDGYPAEFYNFFWNDMKTFQ